MIDDFTGAIPVKSGKFSSTVSPLLAPSLTFNCSGGEMSLLQCHAVVEEQGCIRDDAGVICQGKSMCLWRH